LASVEGGEIKTEKKRGRGDGQGRKGRRKERRKDLITP
jgi:hypothetical protein